MGIITPFSRSIAPSPIPATEYAVMGIDSCGRHFSETVAAFSPNDARDAARRRVAARGRKEHTGATVKSWRGEPMPWSAEA